VPLKLKNSGVDRSGCVEARRRSIICFDTQFDLWHPVSIFNMTKFKMAVLRVSGSLSPSCHTSTSASKGSGRRSCFLSANL